MGEIIPYLWIWALGWEDFTTPIGTWPAFSWTAHWDLDMLLFSFFSFVDTLWILCFPLLSSALKGVCSREVIRGSLVEALWCFVHPSMASECPQYLLHYLLVFLMVQPFFIFLCEKR